MHLVRHMGRAPYESVAAPVSNNAADLVELNNVAAPNLNCRTELTQAQFKRRTFHVPNLIPLIKYMKRSTFESIKFNICNLGRPKN